MLNVLNIAKTGLKSMQNKIDSIADDISNVNSSGYKRKEVSFQELMVNEIYGNEVLMSENIDSAGINMGSKSEATTINFEQGVIRESSGEFHMAISGKGFFGVRDQNGNLMLTRNGGFHINENHIISDDSGYALDVDMYIPFNKWGDGKASVTAEGNITKDINGENKSVGKIILYNPEELNLLTSLGEGRYMPSPSAELYNSVDQEEGFGIIIQHALESSNVELAKSMADMITAQRAYSMSGKAIQAADDIMSIINNIKQ